MKRLAALLILLAACQADAQVGSNFLLLDSGRPACSDVIDNDGDDRIDYPFDPGCDSELDRDETDPLTPPACSNGVDDDGDTVADFPLEPGCESAADTDETDPPTPPQCADGVDNDASTLIDYPADPGCYAAGDPEESSLTQ
jgi:hypothetical protein